MTNPTTRTASGGEKEREAVVAWAGVLIADMSREELIDVINQLGLQVSDAMGRHRHTLNMWSLARGKR